MEKVLFFMGNNENRVGSSDIVVDCLYLYGQGYRPGSE